jgi:hypothetical protein
LGALISCPRGNPDGLHIHRKAFHIRHQYFLPERIILFDAPDARFSYDVISKEMPVPIMTVSEIKFLLSLSPSSN